MRRLRILGITLYLMLMQSVCFAAISDNATSMNAAEPGTFDNLQSVFMDFAIDGTFNLQDQALYLIGVFAIISLCTNWALYTGEWRLQQMVGVVLKTSFFIMLALSWADILNMIFTSFRTAGLVAGGGTDVTEILKPSAIIRQSDVLTGELASALAKGSAASTSTSGLGFVQDALSQIPLHIFSLITYLVVKACFYWMAFSLVLVNIEFAMFTCITMLMMPFGMLRWTETYFNKSVNGVFHFGIKMMVLYFILLLLQSNTKTFTWLAQSAEPLGRSMSFGDMFNIMAMVFLTALLVWLLPELAAGLLDGNPNLSAGTAVAGTGRAFGLGRTGYYYGSNVVRGGFRAGRAVARSKKVQQAAAWVKKWF